MKPVSHRRWAAVWAAAAMLSSGALAAEEWVAGTVRRIDSDQLKMTVQHEEIKSLQMPPMRMVFRVSSAELLQGLSVGDSIEFTVAEQSGAYVILKAKKKP
jgi:Cu(I)/Ag(I) efflux system protein CusF